MGPGCRSRLPAPIPLVEEGTRTRSRRFAVWAARTTSEFDRLSSVEGVIVFHRTTCTRITISFVALVAGVTTAMGTALAPANGATSITNTTPRGLANCKAMSQTITAACKAGAISDFNRARAKEHLRPLVLPRNFTSLTTNQRILVLVDLELRARHLAPYIGLNTTLNRDSQTAANNNVLPGYPSWAQTGGASFRHTLNPFWTVYDWMYYDGEGAGTNHCTSAETWGCWQDRQSVLAAPSGPYHPLVMGAAENSKYGTAALYLGKDTHDTTFTFRWASEAKYFPGGKLP